MRPTCGNIFIVASLFLIGHHHCTAQQLKKVPANEFILFQDGLSNNRYPASAWHLNNKLAVVTTKMTDGVPVMEYAKGNGIFAEAKIKADTTHHAQVYFECDYMPEDTGSANFLVSFSAGNYRYNRFVSVDRYWLNEGWMYKDNRRDDKPADLQLLWPLHRSFQNRRFSPAGWHHLVIIFKERHIAIFLDEHALTNSPNFGDSIVNERPHSGFIPDGFSLGGYAPYVVKNVKFTAGDKVYPGY